MTPNGRARVCSATSGACWRRRRRSSLSVKVKRAKRRAKRSGSKMWFHHMFPELILFAPKTGEKKRGRKKGRKKGCDETLPGRTEVYYYAMKALDFESWRAYKQNKTNIRMRKERITRKSQLASMGVGVIWV